MLAILLKAQYCYITGQVGNMSTSVVFHTISFFSLRHSAIPIKFTLSCLTICQVDRGVQYMCEVLKEVNEQRQSKSWYLLRARTLQTCCTYLSLDTAVLPEAQRSLITQHG